MVRVALDRNGSGYIFHGRDGGPIGNYAIATALRRAGINATPHGFRSSFKDWARNHGIEHDLCLAHVKGSKTVRRAHATTCLRSAGLCCSSEGLPGRGRLEGRNFGNYVGKRRTEVDRLRHSYVFPS